MSIPDTAPSPVDGPTRSRTRGAEIARLIEDEIVAAGWQIGDALGSESTLMERFAVSRSVIREAVRILESRHVALPRRGPGGGLVVTAPKRSAVLDHASLYLEYAGLCGVDVLQTMEVLEIAAATELAATITPAGIARLRVAIDEEFHASDPRTLESTVSTAMGRLSGNPVLGLFLEIAYKLGLTHGEWPNESERQWLRTRNTELVDAIEAGDALAAQRAVRRKVHALIRRQAVRPERTVSEFATAEPASCRPFAKES